MFTAHKKTKDRLQSYCIECGKIIKKQWRTNNKDRSDEYFSNYRKTNKDNIRLINKKYRKKYPEKEKLKSFLYKKNNPHKCSQWAMTRKARISYCCHADHNKNIEEVFHKMRYRLSKCVNIYYHVDHILPLTKGGFHHHGNLQVIPGKLNEMKGTSLEFQHPSLIHWTELPSHLLLNITR
jgi:hypothetical protein